MRRQGPFPPFLVGPAKPVAATGRLCHFQKLVDLVMIQEPYRSARRVFWITDNGSSHRLLAKLDAQEAQHLKVA
jgi:hypothetical protein